MHEDSVNNAENNFLKVPLFFLEVLPFARRKGVTLRHQIMANSSRILG